MQNKLDIDGVRFSLDNIVSTLQLVMEDMEQEFWKETSSTAWVLCIFLS